MGLLSFIADLLFPPRCAFCRKVLRTGENGMCEVCEKTIAYVPGGKIFRGADANPGYTSAIAPLYYDGLVRSSILRYKFSDMSVYSKIYGKLLARRIKTDFDGKYDIITWVPLSGERLKKRGYDQAMLLALAAALELDDVAVETLRKTADVPAQSGVGNAEKRRANIKDAYTASDPELVRDKRILLIDDIMTTGATLSECAVTLRNAGAKEIICACLAKTRD